MARLRVFTQSVPDFRRHCKGNLRHKLSDILILMILGRASGHVGRADIIEFGRHNLKKFRKMGMLRNGVPSEATLCRIENGVDDTAMADRMQDFIEMFHKQLLRGREGREILCIDGKAERGTVQSNGRNPDIVSAYSFDTGLVLATEPCQEKSNEIKAVPLLIDKVDVRGKIVTADAMSMQKDIVDKIRSKGGDFLIEIKANQRALSYGVEDRLKSLVPRHSYTEGPELGHGRIESRAYRVFAGTDVVVDKEKWGSELTIIEYVSDTVRKSTGTRTTEKRLYATSLSPDTPLSGAIIRNHWSIESMHWSLDVTLGQDDIRRKTSRSARNLDTIQRTVYSLFSIWKGLRKKKTDKSKGLTKIMRQVSMCFTKLLRFLSQK